MISRPTKSIVQSPQNQKTRMESRQSYDSSPTKLVICPPAFIVLKRPHIKLSGAHQTFESCVTWNFIRSRISCERIYDLESSTNEESNICHRRVWVLMDLQSPCSNKRAFGAVAQLTTRPGDNEKRFRRELGQKESKQNGI
ncbi:hypothetical protein TNCT_516651 [Trichonephila clavata]|uniref:Uncharacterized protein n=1 Tax=Trichonephila clavata TaxID=2740835 RepID=A0A8X6HD01_TRICU|nr:hypothetical protein TNCT_516651 [Trichonephila clavata]